MFENIDYLQQVRCNGIVWKLEPAVFDLGDVPECKFTVQVGKKLKTSLKREDGAFRYHCTYWKCIIKSYKWNTPIYEKAKNLKVGTPVFVRGEYYFTPYIGQDGKPKYAYGIIVRELDAPKTLAEDCRIAELLSHHYPTRKEREKGFYRDKFGEKVILDGGIGKRRVTNYE